MKITRAVGPALTTGRMLYRVARRLYSASEATTSIPAPREAVYAGIADPRTYPTWLAGAQKIHDVDPSFPRRGSGFEHRVGPTDEVAIDDHTISLAARAPERLDLQVHAGAFSGVVEFHLRPRADHTEVTLRERPRGLWLAAMPLLRVPLFLRNQSSLRRLAKLLQLQAPPGTASRRDWGL